jgi:hypothetical protein
MVTLDDGFRADQELWIRLLDWLQTYREEIGNRFNQYIEYLEAAIPPQLHHRIAFGLKQTDLTDVSNKGIFHIAAEPHWQASKDYELYKVGGVVEAGIKYACANEASLPFHFWSMLAMVGAAARRQFTNGDAATMVIPAQYICLVAGSGNKKNIAANYGKDLLRRSLEKVKLRFAPLSADDTPAFNILDACQVVSNCTSFSALMEQLQIREKLDPGMKAVSLSQDPKLTEKLEEAVLRRHSIGAVFAPEITTLLGKESVEAARVADMFIECWNGGDQTGHYEDNTQAHGKREMEGLAVTLVGGMQPGLMRNKLHHSVIEAGFAARVLWIYRDARDLDIYMAVPDDAKLREDIVEFMFELQTNKTYKSVNLTPEADAWFKGWYETVHCPQRDNMKGHLLEPYYERKDKHIRKVALCIVIGRGITWIDLETIQLATAIVDAEEPTMKQVYGFMSQSEDVANLDKLRRLLRGFCQDGWATETECWRYIGANIKVYGKREQAVQALGMLNMEGSVHLQKARSKGNNRETTFYRMDGSWARQPQYLDRNFSVLTEEWDPNQTRRKD